jgi:hypothetical protein
VLLCRSRETFFDLSAFLCCESWCGPLLFLVLCGSLSFRCWFRVVSEQCGFLFRWCGCRCISPPSSSRSTPLVLTSFSTPPWLQCRLCGCRCRSPPSSSRSTPLVLSSFSTPPRLRCRLPVLLCSMLWPNLLVCCSRSPSQLAVCSPRHWINPMGSRLNRKVNVMRMLVRRSQWLLPCGCLSIV